MFNANNIKTDEQITSEQAATAEAAEEQAAKTQGVKYKSFDISLNEANQNGLSAIMSAENLAIEFESSIFPIKFKAETAGGFEMVELEDFAEFKSFALVFLSARQAFFK